MVKHLPKAAFESLSGFLTTFWLSISSLLHSGGLHQNALTVGSESDSSHFLSIRPKFIGMGCSLSFACIIRAGALDSLASITNFGMLAALEAIWRYIHKNVSADRMSIRPRAVSEPSRVTTLLRVSTTMKPAPWKLANTTPYLLAGMSLEAQSKANLVHCFKPYVGSLYLLWNSSTSGLSN